MRKPQSYNYVLFLEVYPFHVMFSFGETDKQLLANLKTSIGNNEEARETIDKLNLSETTKGKYLINNKNQSFIRLKSLPFTAEMKGILQHEISHCVFHIMRIVGIKHTFHSEEAYTYLIQFITISIYKQLLNENNRTI